MSTTLHYIAQRSPEWHALRLGRLCASDAKAMLATVKSGEAADRKSTRLNSSHVSESRMPSSA